MTLRFYNGVYSIESLVDKEDIGCLDLVLQMRWRRPGVLARVNFTTCLYLGILLLSIMSSKARGHTAVAHTFNNSISTFSTTPWTYETITNIIFSTTSVYSSSSTLSDSTINSIQQSNLTAQEICESKPGAEKSFEYLISGSSISLCHWRTRDMLNYCLSKTKNSLQRPSTRACEECINITKSNMTQVAKYLENFRLIMERFDCKGKVNFSIWTCLECERVYIDWLCATQLTYFKDSVGILPCDQFCIRAEARCPYFLPQKQYCGQQAYLCNRHKWNSTDKCFKCNFTDETEDTAFEGHCNIATVDATTSNFTPQTVSHLSPLTVLLVGLASYILSTWTLLVAYDEGT